MRQQLGAPPSRVADAARYGDSLVVLVYAGGAYPARPSVPAGQVRYVGPVQPTDWLANDEWINNS